VIFQLKIYDQHNTILCCFYGISRYLWLRVYFLNEKSVFLETLNFWMF